MIDGKIINTGYSDSYGYYVNVEISKNSFISYNHLNKILVKNGDTVKSGDIIAKSGNTGNSTGPHLHLSLFINEIPIDILSLVNYNYTDNFVKEYEQRGVPFVYENSN